jgi:hypothetical protein
MCNSDCSLAPAGTGGMMNCRRAALEFQLVAVISRAGVVVVFVVVFVVYPFGRHKSESESSSHELEGPQQPSRKADDMNMAEFQDKTPPNAGERQRRSKFVWGFCPCGCVSTHSGSHLSPRSRHRIHCTRVRRPAIFCAGCRLGRPCGSPIGAWR